MQKKTKTTFSNCYFAFFYMILRKSVNGIIFTKSESRLWPFHFMGVTKNGNILHFQHVNGFADKMPPFWFGGNIVGIRKSKINKDKIVKYTDNKIFIYSLLFLIWITLLIPWMIFVALYWPLWTIYWGIKACL